MRVSPNFGEIFKVALKQSNLFLYLLDSYMIC